VWLTNWWIHHEMKPEARRLAKFVAEHYRESKAEHPSATEREVILQMAFDRQARKVGELDWQRREREGH
jgi:hypothetical protein